MLDLVLQEGKLAGVFYVDVKKKDSSITYFEPM